MPKSEYKKAPSLAPSYSDYIILILTLSQAESREEELGALKRKADYLGRQAQAHLARGDNDDEDGENASDDYYELVSLAQRLNTVSEQLKGNHKVHHEIFAGC